TARAELGWWQPARADLEALVGLPGAKDDRRTLLVGDYPSQHEVFYQLALLQFRAGDGAGYRRDCARLVDEFGPGRNRPDSRAAQALRSVCVLAPDSGVAPETLARLAGMLDGEATRHPDEGLWGAALFRAGQFAEAAKHLQRESERLAGVEKQEFDSSLPARR